MCAEDGDEIEEDEIESGDEVVEKDDNSAQEEDEEEEEVQVDWEDVFRSAAEATSSVKSSRKR